VYACRLLAELSILSGQDLTRIEPQVFPMGSRHVGANRNQSPPVMFERRTANGERSSKRRDGGGRKLQVPNAGRVCSIYEFSLAGTTTSIRGSGSWRGAGDCYGARWENCRDTWPSFVNQVFQTALDHPNHHRGHFEWYDRLPSMGAELILVEEPQSSTCPDLPSGCPGSVRKDKSMQASRGAPVRFPERNVRL
jgi:hypothetical protein